MLNPLPAVALVQEGLQLDGEEFAYQE